MTVTCNQNGHIMQGVVNGWVKNVEVVNSDVGVRCDRCQLVTIRNVNLVSGTHMTSTR